MEQVIFLEVSSCILTEKKVLDFYGTCRFITMFTRAYHCYIFEQDESSSHILAPFF